MSLTVASAKTMAGDRCPSGSMGWGFVIGAGLHKRSILNDEVLNTGYSGCFHSHKATEGGLLLVFTIKEHIYNSTLPRCSETWTRSQLLKSNQKNVCFSNEFLNKVDYSFQLLQKLR